MKPANSGHVAVHEEPQAIAQDCGAQPQRQHKRAAMKSLKQCPATAKHCRVS
eukprot:CAMPEP_0172877348 /NCGR_PEP_ID=MMETSP1075-20121228/106768_1 /TAXON_ID=2916 /ORGANISM="Ceratium fusus, Strain PA161109" /LENGTH=51 /DNA_ID=CAMNT_0013728895 /DNA_START=547 /DNA_END=702 /DNA_ORIENTATION=+